MCSGPSSPMWQSLDSSPLSVLLWSSIQRADPAGALLTGLGWLSECTPTPPPGHWQEQAGQCVCCTCLLISQPLTLPFSQRVEVGAIPSAPLTISTSYVCCWRPSSR